MMSMLLGGFAVFLLLNLAAGMLRAHRGPSSSDRMLAALLFGSTVVALLLVLAELNAMPALRDVALLFVLLAAILSVAFVGMPSRSGGDEDLASPGEDEVAAGDVPPTTGVPAAGTPAEDAPAPPQRLERPR